MFVYLLLGLVVIGVVVGVVMSSRWAGDRGWVYNKHNPRRPGAGIPGGAFGQIFKPETEHVVEEMRSEQDRADQDESGDDLD